MMSVNGSELARKPAKNPKRRWYVKDDMTGAQTILKYIMGKRMEYAGDEILV